MSVFDVANDFAASLKETDEYKALKTAKEALEKDQENYRKAQDYIEKQIEFQSRQMQGEELPQEEIDAYNEQADKIMEIPVIANYFMAQVSFSVFYQDITDRIMQSLDINLRLLDEEVM